MSYRLLTKLLISGKVKFTAGKIIAFDNYFALVPLLFIKEMTDDAMKLGKKAINDLYFYGWLYGLATTKDIVRIFKLRKFEERYKVCMDIIGVLGFGDYKTLSFKRADHAKFKVLDNPFAKQYYPSDKLVCHFLRGVEAGGGTLVHEILINNIEFECTAGNRIYCLHSNLSPENIDKLDKRLVDSQLDRQYLLKKQKEVMERYGYNPSDFGI